MEAFKHLGIGLVATAALITASVLFERTGVGHELEVHAYEYLQHALPSLTGGRLPVVVVDISKVPGGKDHPTPREILQELLAAIAAKGPRAMAVDIDFSPDERGWMTPADPAFFDFCLTLVRQRATPVFLGVFRTREEGPDTWLGLPRYQHLAAAGLAKGDDTRRLPRWVKSDHSTTPLPTIGEALASSYRASAPLPAQWLSWALEPAEIERTPRELSATGGGSVDVLVNYSKLAQLESETLVISQAATVEDLGELLRGRLVLLGDASEPMDTFTVPGETGPVPGVYLMASAAYTIAIDPLFEFTHGVRVALDGLISLVIVLGVYRINHQTLNVARRRKRRGRFLLIAVALVIAAGYALVRIASIMWLDFLLAPLAMFLHPRVEDWLVARFKPNRRVRHGSAA